MSNTELLVLSMALGMDLFSVTVPIGMQRIRRSVVLQASLVFAGFHMAMLLSGYYAGRWLGGLVDQLGVYSNAPGLMIENCAGIAGAWILIGLGILMIKADCGKKKDAVCRRGALLHGWALMVLAFSVSVDAMAAGLGFGMMEVDLVVLNLILGIVIFCISMLGLCIGRRVGRFLGARSELIGGSVLIFIGGHILWRFLS